MAILVELENKSNVPHASFKAAILVKRTRSVAESKISVNAIGKIRDGEWCITQHKQFSHTIVPTYETTK